MEVQGTRASERVRRPRAVTFQEEQGAQAAAAKQAAKVKTKAKRDQRFVDPSVTRARIDAIEKQIKALEKEKAVLYKELGALEAAEQMSKALGLDGVPDNVLGIPADHPARLGLPPAPAKLPSPSNWRFAGGKGKRK
jgi:hypothetical protein